MTQPGARQPSVRAGLIIGVVAPLFAYLVFNTAQEAMDGPNPDVAAGRSWHLLALAVAAASLATVRPILGPPVFPRGAAYLLTKLVA